jgi:hypothetical protein
VQLQNGTIDSAPALPPALGARKYREKEFVVQALSGAAVLLVSASLPFETAY